MKCEICPSHAAIVRHYRGCVEGMFCEQCYIDYLLLIRESKGLEGLEGQEQEQELEYELQHIYDNAEGV